MISSFSLYFLFGVLSIVFHRTKLLKPFTLLGVALAFVATYMGLGVGFDGFALSATSHLFELVVAVVLFAFLVQEEDDITATQILLLGASSSLLLESQTLLSFVLSFESLSLISVILVSQIKTKEQADGAIKIFIAGSVATGIIFLGVGFYLLGGGELLAPLHIKTNYFESIGLALLLVGLFYKLTLFPFYGWAVDSYTLVRHNHAALLSGVAKTVVAVAVFHIYAPFLREHIELSTPLLIAIAVITMTLGNFLALFRKRLALMLSYSSIAHAGYLLVAFVALRSEYAEDAIVYISIAYIFMQSAAFLMLEILKKEYAITTFTQLAGFSKHNAQLAALFTLQLFSLAGIPLLAGFLGKAVVFYAVVDAGYWWVALIGLLNSALSVAYYAWVIKTIYFDDAVNVNVEKKTLTFPLVSQTILAFGTLFFGMFAWVVFDLV
jgi:NADH-quinone oxidoreductase subunit N